MWQAHSQDFREGKYGYLLNGYLHAILCKEIVLRDIKMKDTPLFKRSIFKWEERDWYHKIPVIPVIIVK